MLSVTLPVAFAAADIRGLARNWQQLDSVAFQHTVLSLVLVLKVRRIDVAGSLEVTAPKQRDHPVLRANGTDSRLLDDTGAVNATRLRCATHGSLLERPILLAFSHRQRPVPYRDGV